MPALRTQKTRVVSPREVVCISANPSATEQAPLCISSRRGYHGNTATWMGSARAVLEPCATRPEPLMRIQRRLAFLVSLAAFDVISTDPGILQKHEARSRTESLNDCLEEMKTLAADICITRQKYFLTVAYLCHLTVTVECLKIFQIRSISRYVFFINKQKCSDNLRK